MKRVHSTVIEEAMKECLYCNMKIPISYSKQHEVDLHFNETITCKHCGKKSLNTYQQKQHENNTHNDRNCGYCNICEKKYHSISKHNNEKHSGKTFPCDHCAKIFGTKTLLVFHKKSVEGTLVRKQCPECPNSYINLRDNILTFHRGEVRPSHKDKNKCNVCKKLISQYGIEFHKSVCLQQSQTCSLCSKHVTNLEKHLQSMHTVVRSQVCLDIFPGSAVILPILRNHIYDKHIQDICNELQISDCIETEDVTVRERISECFVEHKSERENNRFSCLLCKQSYITRTSITYHMKHHLKYTSRRGKTKCHPCTDCGEMVKPKINHLHKCVIQTFAFMESQQQKKSLEHPDKNKQEHDRLERENEQQEQKYLKQQKLHQQELDNLKNEPDQNEDQHLEHQEEGKNIREKLKKEQEQQKENYEAEQEIKQEELEEEAIEMIKQDIYLQTKEQQNMDQVEEQQLSHHKKNEE